MHLAVDHDLENIREYGRAAAGVGGIVDNKGFDSVFLCVIERPFERTNRLFYIIVKNKYKGIAFSDAVNRVVLPAVDLFVLSVFFRSLRFEPEFIYYIVTVHIQSKNAFDNLFVFRVSHIVCPRFSENGIGSV